MIKLHFRLVYIFLSISDVLANSANNSTRKTTENPVSDLLSKFHQNEYKLIYERTEVAQSNASLIDIQIRTFKYNRTTTAINGSFISTVDMGYDVEIIIQAYKLASNEYREFPMRFEVNLCKSIAKSVFGFDKLATTSGNVACPFLKRKKYYFYNWTPDETKFPPLIPTGSYMMKMFYFYQSQELMCTQNYLTIYRPIPIA